MLFAVLAGLAACSSSPEPSQSISLAEMPSRQFAEGAPASEAGSPVSPEPPSKAESQVQPKQTATVPPSRPPVASSPIVAKPSPRRQDVEKESGQPKRNGKEAPHVRIAEPEPMVSSPPRSEVIKPEPADASSRATALDEVPEHPERASADLLPETEVPESSPSSERAVEKGRPELVIPPPPPRPGATDGAAVHSDRRATSASEAPPPREHPAETVVPEGTVIQVRLAERLSTETNRDGDRFQSILDRDIENARGDVIIPKGTAVEGTIVSVAEPGRVKGRAGLTFRLDRIVMGHEEPEITTNDITIEAESGTGDDIKKVGVGAAVGAALGAIFGGKHGAAVGGAAGAGSSTAQVLLTRGKQVEIERERLFSFRLEKDLILSER